MLSAVNEASGEIAGYAAELQALDGILSGLEDRTIAVTLNLESAAAEAQVAAFRAELESLTRLRRPSSRSGEDWNSEALDVFATRIRLRPAYGPGEDWNQTTGKSTSGSRRCARSTGRARIGTFPWLPPEATKNLPIICHPLLDMSCDTRHNTALIKSFKDKETQRLFMGRKQKAVSGQTARRAQIKLAQLDQAESVEELRAPPGNRLHKLGGDREGQWAISVNEQYRICFRFEGGDAYDVECTDYH